ncbi:MAG: DNA-directed RNA polymerase subunit delta [Erysipelotrichaceae bacterium]|nr:DNA-directed RNA polymerase subunit delta [Erysipelotrichaceae bacterium]
MSAKSMTDVAYEYLSKRKKSVEFLKLWNEVNLVMSFPENKVASKKAQFYSELMLDNRFASLEDNKWDLRNRRKFDEVFIDTDAIIIDSDDDEEELELDEEEKEEDFIEE